MRGFSLLVALLIAATVGAAASYLWVTRGSTGNANGRRVTQRPVAEDTQPPALGRTVDALGTLSPRGGIVSIGGPAGDRLAEVLVREGDYVEAGAHLAYLHSRELRQSEEALAKAQLEEARARATAEAAYGDRLIEEARVEMGMLDVQEMDIAAHKARLELAEKNLEVARKNLERLSGLDPGIVSPQERETSELAVEQAEAERRAARVALEKLEATLELSKQQAEAALRTAEANRKRLDSGAGLATAEGNLKLARTQLELTAIRAPSNGQVLEILTRPGEVLSGQPIMTFGDTNQMEVIAEVYETDIRRVQVGQAVIVTSDALPTSLKGTVRKIGSLVGKRQTVSLDPTASADARTIEVTIALDDSKQASKLVNLQVEVKILVDQPLVENLPDDELAARRSDSADGGVE